MNFEIIPNIISIALLVCAISFVVEISNVIKNKVDKLQATLIDENVLNGNENLPYQSKTRIEIGMTPIKVKTTRVCASIICILLAYVISPIDPEILFKFFFLWSCCGALISGCIIWIASIFFTHGAYDEPENVGKKVYLTAIILGGPIMWAFAHWLEKQPSP